MVLTSQIFLVPFQQRKYEVSTFVSRVGKKKCVGTVEGPKGVPPLNHPTLLMLLKNVEMLKSTYNTKELASEIALKFIRCRYFIGESGLGRSARLMMFYWVD